MRIKAQSAAVQAQLEAEAKSAAAAEAEAIGCSQQEAGEPHMQPPRPNLACMLHSRECALEGTLACVPLGGCLLPTVCCYPYACVV